jgi:ketosteroid isomerase-like protein
VSSQPEQDNVERVRAFFAAISSGASEGELARFYAADVVQEEFPNRFLPNGATRGLKELQEASARGKKAMSSQRFEILNLVAEGDTVVVESSWEGTLAVPIGDTTPAGTVMRARFAQVFEFRDGLIAGQRNYDCFYPW